MRDSLLVNKIFVKRYIILLGGLIIVIFVFLVYIFFQSNVLISDSKIKTYQNDNIGLKFNYLESYKVVEKIGTGADDLFPSSVRIYKIDNLKNSSYVVATIYPFSNNLEENLSKKILNLDFNTVSESEFVDTVKVGEMYRYYVRNKDNEFMEIVCLKEECGWILHALNLK